MGTRRQARPRRPRPDDRTSRPIVLSRSKTPNSPVDAPIYTPFVKRPVREQDEQSNTLGPGIRINTDDDNNNSVADRLEYGYEIPEENDLIEVKVDRLPGQGDLVLRDGGKLSLFYDHDKETPIPLDAETFDTEPLPFVNNTINVFVEWIDYGHGTDNLFLIDPATSAVLDTIRLHSFRGLVVVFGGRHQDPRDTDGDGSIGDPVGGSATNREGIFDLAQTLYDTGWDVLAFESTNFDIDDNVAATEIKNAQNQRSVEQYAVLGYSWGGGVTHDLLERLYEDLYPASFGVFLDAVVHSGVSAQDDWPTDVLYLLNIWQSLPFHLGGAAIFNPEEMSPFSTLEEINVTTEAGWNHDLDHYSIDDDLQVQLLVRTRLSQLLSR